MCLCYIRTSAGLISPLEAFLICRKLTPKVYFFLNRFFNSLPSTCCSKGCSLSMYWTDYPSQFAVVFFSDSHGASIYMHYVQEIKEYIYLQYQPLYVHKNKPMHKFSTPLCAPKFAVKAHHLKPNVIWPSIKSPCKSKVLVFSHTLTSGVTCNLSLC